MDNYKKTYEQKGIVTIPSVFSEEECDNLKREAYKLTGQAIKDAGYPHSPIEMMYNRKALVFYPSLVSRYINNIRTDDRMVNLVREFIGPDVKQINNQIYFREKNTADQFAWHQDLMFREPDNFHNDVAEDYFQTIIAVDDITIDNGAVEFIEGTHKTERIPAPTNLREFIRSGRQGKKYTAKKGDVLIWSVLIIHGSEPNKSKTSDRMTFMNGFCRSKAVKGDKYADYLKDGCVVKHIDPRKIP